jgi:hypothetical protein
MLASREQDTSHQTQVLDLEEVNSINKRLATRGVKRPRPADLDDGADKGPKGRRGIRPGKLNGVSLAKISPEAMRSPRGLPSQLFTPKAPEKDTAVPSADYVSAPTYDTAYTGLDTSYDAAPTKPEVGLKDMLSEVDSAKRFPFFFEFTCQNCSNALLFHS